MSAAAACRPGPPTDSSFRTRDAALLARFAALEGRCAPRWAGDRECLARLQDLRVEERRLFAEVRAHRFADETESNYWRRGRLKFPGRIEQILNVSLAGSGLSRSEAAGDGPGLAATTRSPSPSGR